MKQKLREIVSEIVVSAIAILTCFGTNSTTLTYLGLYEEPLGRLYLYLPFWTVVLDVLAGALQWLLGDCHIVAVPHFDQAVIGCDGD